MEAKPIMSWDTPLQEAVVIPEKNAAGEKIVYDFTVKTFKKNPAKVFSKDNNPYTAYSIDLTFVVKAMVDDEMVEGLVEDMLILAPKSQFKLFAYFTAIGKRKHGEGTFNPAAVKAYDVESNIGESGRMTVRHDVFNGITRIKVDKYMEPVAGDVDL